MNDWSPNGDTAKALNAFQKLTGCPAFTRIVQRGRDRDLATYSLELADGRTITIGTVDKLWSPDQFGKAVFVATQIAIKRVKLADWQNALAALADIIETQTDGEAIADWLARYLPRSNSLADREAAVPAREPFTEDGRLHVHPDHFAGFIRREVGEQIRLKDVRALLEELGYQSVKINYSPDGTRTARTSARYMREPESGSHGNGEAGSAQSSMVTGE